MISQQATKQDLLIQMAELEACFEATEWVREQQLETAQQIWDACESPSWLLWYATRRGVAHKTLVRLAAAFARSVLFLVPEGENRLRVCVETVEAWCEGRATIEQVREARRDASAYAASAAAAAYAAYAYAAASRTETRKQVQLAQCELIRKAIPACPFKEGVR